MLHKDPNDQNQGEKVTGRLTASLKPVVSKGPFTGRWVRWPPSLVDQCCLHCFKELLTIKNHICGVCVMKGKHPESKNKEWGGGVEDFKEWRQRSNQTFQNLCKQERGEWSQHLALIERKLYQPRIQYPVKSSFETKGKIKFSKLERLCFQHIYFTINGWVLWNERK